MDVNSKTWTYIKLLPRLRHVRAAFLVDPKAIRIQYTIYTNNQILHVATGCVKNCPVQYIEPSFLFVIYVEHNFFFD